MPAYHSTAIKHPKQSHSFQTKLRHYCGQLSSQDKKSIPRSTLSYWLKSKLVGDFKTNTLWQTIDDIEPARLIFENKKLKEQNNILMGATMGLSAIIKNMPLTVSNKKNIVESIDKLKQYITLKEACGFFNITTHQYYAWKNNAGCHQSLVKLCRKKYPNQLTDTETNLIKKYLTNEKYLQWSRATVYWQLCRAEGNLFAKSTFYKYCNLLGFGRRRGPVKCKKDTGGIKATKPGEIIHVDITEIYTHNHTKVYILFVQDNFSRKIIGFHAALSSNGILQAATIKQALKKPGSNMDTATIITDGGSENKGQVDAMLAHYFPLAKKITAKVDIPFANNMVVSCQL